MEASSFECKPQQFAGKEERLCHMTRFITLLACLGSQKPRASFNSHLPSSHPHSHTSSSALISLSQVSGSPARFMHVIQPPSGNAYLSVGEHSRLFIQCRGDRLYRQPVLSHAASVSPPSSTFNRRSADLPEENDQMSNVPQMDCGPSQAADTGTLRYKVSLSDSD